MAGGSESWSGGAVAEMPPDSPVLIPCPPPHRCRHSGLTTVPKG